MRIESEIILAYYWRHYFKTWKNEEEQSHLSWNMMIGSFSRSLMSIPLPFLMTSGCFSTNTHPMWLKKTPLAELYGSASIKVSKKIAIFTLLVIKEPIKDLKNILPVSLKAWCPRWSRTYDNKLNSIIKLLLEKWKGLSLTHLWCSWIRHKDEKDEKRNRKII